jgi:hypothetical protein
LASFQATTLPHTAANSYIQIGQKEKEILHFRKSRLKPPYQFSAGGFQLLPAPAEPGGETV